MLRSESRSRNIQCLKLRINVPAEGCSLTCMQALHSVLSMLRKTLTVCLFILVWPGMSAAMPVGHLYEAIVPVPDQSDSERRQAQHKAVGQILVKLTGDTAIIDNQRAKPLINQAQNYVQQYRYLEPEPDSNGPAGSKGLRLWVGFDSTAVDEALQRAGIATWGKERPATLVWLAVATDQGRQIIGMEQSSQYLEPVNRRARERGLPLLLPLMDLEDTTRLDPADIANGSVAAIREASARYPADVILAVSLTGLDSDRVTANWTLISDKAGNDNWRSQAASLTTVLSGGVDRLADTLARRYAPQAMSSEARQMELTVTAIESFDDYARAQRYLAGLSSVSRVDVLSARPGEVVFRVETRAGDESFNQAITIGRTLRRASGTSDNRYSLLP